MKILKKIQKKVSDSLVIHDRITKFMVKSELLKNMLVTSHELGIAKQKMTDSNVVVSLTTYGKRLYSVYLTIESIMQGTMKPNRIILWLQDDLKQEELPQSLLKQKDRGLEIYFTKDIRSYKKLIPTLKLCPDDIIITIDDDVLYEIDTIERLVYAYKKDPHFVYACRVRKIAIDKKGNILSYKKWKPIVNGSEPSSLNLPVGVGGVLYPPHCFTEEVFNEERFMSLCPRADDLWFWFMAKLKGYNAVKVYTHDEAGMDFLTNMNVQDVALAKSNLKDGGNDSQLLALMREYDVMHCIQII